MLEPKNSKFWSFLVFAGIAVIFVLFLLVKEKVFAEEFFDIENGIMEKLPISEETTFLQSAPPNNGDSYALRKIPVIVTAYSSTLWETDFDPFITASGKTVRDGIVANNLLAFGTQIRLPEIFGDKIFVVEDKMNQRKGYYHVDVWFPSYEEAAEFGVKITEMEVMAN